MSTGVEIVGERFVACTQQLISMARRLIPEVTSWLDAHEGSASVYATVALVLITGWYVHLTRSLARTAVRDRLDARMPRYAVIERSARVEGLVWTIEIAVMAEDRARIRTTHPPTIEIEGHDRLIEGGTTELVIAQSSDSHRFRPLAPRLLLDICPADTNSVCDRIEWYLTTDYIAAVTGRKRDPSDRVLVATRMYRPDGASRKWWS